MDLSVVLWLAWLAFWWGGTITAIVSAVRQPERAWERSNRTMAGTILGIILSCGIGGLYYWFGIRPELRRLGDPMYGVAPKQTGPYAG